MCANPRELFANDSLSGKGSSSHGGFVGQLPKFYQKLLWARKQSFAYLATPNFWTNESFLECGGHRNKRLCRLGTQTSTTAQQRAITTVHGSHDKSSIDDFIPWLFPLNLTLNNEHLKFYRKIVRSRETAIFYDSPKKKSIPWRLGQSWIDRKMPDRADTRVDRHLSSSNRGGTQQTVSRCTHTCDVTHVIRHSVCECIQNVWFMVY